MPSLVVGFIGSLTDLSPAVEDKPCYIMRDRLVRLFEPLVLFLVGWHWGLFVDGILAEYRRNATNRIEQHITDSYIFN